MTHTIAKVCPSCLNDFEPDHGATVYCSQRCRQDVINARQREVRASNPQAHYEATKRWKLENPEKFRESHRRSSQRKRQERCSLIDAIKLERGCIDCGYSEQAVALDFDHRDPSEKRFGIAAKMMCRSWVDILEEIDRCDVRCANCHRIKTHQGVEV